MSLAWMGRRVVRYLVACGLLAALVYAIAKPEPPRVGYAKAIAGIPVNRTAPTLTGDLRLGGVLTCGPGVWDEPATFKTQWVRDGQTSPARPPRPTPSRQADIGHALRCDVPRQQRRLGLGRRRARSPTTRRRPTALTPPRVTGDLRLGRTLNCSRGTWNDDGVPAYPTTTSGRATTTRSPARRLDLHGHQRRHRPPDHLPRGRRARSPPLDRHRRLPHRARDPRRFPPSRGDLRLGGKLSCSRGVWDDEGLTAYAATKQWLRDGAEILGATGDDYTVRLADIGHSIACRVRAADLTDSHVEHRLPDQPVAALAAGHRGRPAARPHAHLHPRHVGRRRPHRRLRRQLRVVPPATSSSPPARRTRSPTADVDKPLRCHGRGRGQDGGQQPDDLRRRPRT